LGEDGKTLIGYVYGDYNGLTSYPINGKLVKSYPSLSSTIVPSPAPTAP